MTTPWWVALHVVFLARKDDLLELEARRRLHDHVHRYPGLHLSEIARGLEIETNHAKYHLQRLERHGLVTSAKDEEGYWRFWPRTASGHGAHRSLPVDDKKVLALLRNPLPLHITLLLLNDDELNHRQLTERTGAAHGTVHYHLKKMERDGLVTSERAGRERRYRVQDPHRAHRLLLAHKPPDRLVAGFLAAWEAVEL